MLPTLRADIDKAIAALNEPDVAGKEQTFTANVGTPVHIKAATAQGGVIRQLTLKASKLTPEALRSTILSIRFDDYETVRTPLGDFFGSGPGLNSYQSLPFSVSADVTMTCRWAMPFQRDATILHQVFLNGQPVGEPVDFYSDKFEPMAAWHLGEFDFKRRLGQRITVMVIGSNPKASPPSKHFGIDAIVIKPVE